LPSLLDWRRVGPDAAPTAQARSHGYGRWLLVGVGWLLVVGAAFVLGYLLAEHDARQALARIQALQTERDLLSEQLAAQRDAQIKLERSHQIDVAAQRAAQSQITSLERERMRLEQQLKHLRALVGSGGRGLAEVEELVLMPRADGAYAYRLTLGQLVPDFGRTEGEVVLSVVSESDGEEATVPVARLSDGSAGRHVMAFEHFQVFEGVFQLDSGTEPLELVVEILPKDDNLMATQEVVRWASALTPDPVTPLESPYAQGVKLRLAPAHGGSVPTTEAVSDH